MGVVARGLRLSFATAKAWTIPAERMKAKRAPNAVVPALLGHPRRSGTPPERARPAVLVFPSVRGRQLSNNVVSRPVRDRGAEAVPHGFHSSFRDWAFRMHGRGARRDGSGLAHAIPNQPEAANARSYLFAEQRELMGPPISRGSRVALGG